MAKLQEKKFFKIIILIVVFLIPIIYSFFYLKSYWDPYGKLTDMDVAIVNLDKGNGDENKGEELVNTLIEKDVIKLTKVSEGEADEGLSNQKYYATITIPSNFTESLNSAKEENKQVATITYRPNQKFNYLASQIINKVVTAAQTEVQNEVSKQVVETLSNNLREVPDSLEKISDGANEINEGSTSLRDGLKELKNATNTINEKFAIFDKGIKSAYAGSNTLVRGTKKVNNGVKDLSKGGNTLEDAIGQINSGADVLMSSGAEGIASLTQGINDLDTGTSKVKDGVEVYVAGTDNLTENMSEYIKNVDKLNSNTKALLESLVNAGKLSTADDTTKALAAKASAILNSKSYEGIMAAGSGLNKGAKDLTSNNNTLTKGVKDLKTGTEALVNSTSGLGTLTDGLSELKDGLNQVDTGTKSLNNGIDTLRSGTENLEEGTKTLREGLKTLSISSDAFKDGIKTLKDGSKEAYNGSKELSRGTFTFKAEIEKGLNDANAELEKLDNLDTHVAKSVTVEEEPYGEVTSYGIAFTPLFLSIGLWVGALMCYVVLYYDQEKRFGILVRNNGGNRIVQNIAYLGISLAMGLLTGFLLKVGLGFEVVSTGIYYLECILIAVTFMSIIQCLIKNLGDIGKFLALIILVLQLASSGGTFPIPLIDKGFQSISMFLPMTYSINIIKDCLIKTDTSLLLHNSLILLGFVAGTLSITAIVDIVKIKKAKKESK